MIAWSDDGKVTRTDHYIVIAWAVILHLVMIGAFCL